MREHLKSFAPWIAFAAGSAMGDWRSGVAAGLVVLAQQRRGPGVELLTAVTTAFFAVFLPIALASPDAGVRPYLAALALGTLGVAATASLLVGKPFTVALARRSTPPELWDDPLFLRVNTVITAVWAASFTVTALVGAVLAHEHSHAVPLWVVAQVVGFVVPVSFTRTYPARVRARLLGPTAA